MVLHVMVTQRIRTMPQPAVAAPHVPLHIVLTFVLLIWWLAQQLQTFFVSSDVDPSATTTATAEGSLVNTALVAAFAAVGAAHLPAARSALRSRALRVFLVLLGAYLAWSLLSL